MGIRAKFELWLCLHFGHKWKSTGGVYCRTCPEEGNDHGFFHDLPDAAYHHSTAVYECQRRTCGDYKYEDYPDCPHAGRKLTTAEEAIKVIDEALRHQPNNNVDEAADAMWTYKALEYLAAELKGMAADRDKWRDLYLYVNRKREELVESFLRKDKKLEAFKRFVIIYDQWDKCVKEFDGDESCCMEYQEAILDAREELKRAVEGEKTK